MPNIINILHLSDLHYSGKNDRHNQKVVLNALKEDLKKVCDGAQKPDFVVFSGDLVKVADEDGVYYELYEEVLEPIKSITRCSDSRIILCAGNHDAHRTVVESYWKQQQSLISALVGRDELNNAYLNKEYNELIAEKFKGFDEIRGYFSTPRADSDNIVQLYHFSGFGDKEIDIVCFNSAWATYGGIDKISDEGKLLLPEAAIINASEKCIGTHKIAVTHHPLDWLTQSSRNDAKALIDKNYNVHLFGHMHDSQPQFVSSLNGQCLSVQGGALYTGRNYYNGYSLISLDLASNHTKVYFRSYYDKRRSFDVGTDISDKGTFFPTSESSKFWNKIEKAVDRGKLRKWLMQILLPEAESVYNEGLTERPICELFVPPTMYKYKAVEQNEDGQITADEQFPVSLSGILASKANHVIHGRPEYGKTTLLKQIALQQLRSCGSAEQITMPILIDYQELKPAKDVLRPFRAALLSEPEDFSIKQLAEEGLLTLLIDDVDFNDKKRLQVLFKLINDYPRNKYIITTLSPPAELGLPVVQDIDTPVDWEHIFLEAYTRKQMRSLVEKWGDNGQFSDNEAVLNRLISEFVHINIPATAVNGTILLTIYEEKSSFSPINRAVLIERFMEHMLEKRSVKEVSRGSFDFKNKELLLSHLAAHMASENRYILPRDELITVVEGYLDGIGLPQNADELVQHFITARILGPKGEDSIGFRYRAFLEYFIALQMQNDAEFKEWVLEEDRYLSFINEINYYAGIVRNDSNLVGLIAQRFDKLAEEVFSDINWSPNLSILERIILPTEQDEFDSIDLIESQIEAPPLTQEERDEVLEAELPKDAENRQDVFRPEFTDIGQKWTTALFLYSGVIKNMEAISDAEKRSHLSKLLHSWSVFTMISLNAAPAMARHRKVRINGVFYHVNMPRAWSEIKVLKSILLDMPNSVSRVLTSQLGTEKLERQLREPLLGENDEPAIVRFYRSSLLSDLRIKGWVKAWSDLTHSLKDSSYLLEAALKKISDTYRLNANDKETESSLRRTIADSIATLRGKDHKDRAKIKSDQMQKIKHQKTMQLMRMNSNEKSADVVDVSSPRDGNPILVPEEVDA